MVKDKTRKTSRQSDIGDISKNTNNTEDKS